MIAAECGDSDACRKLVEAFLPAIGDLARSFKNSRVERLELLQEGVAGLLVAARRYDTTLNTPFWAYASFWENGVIGGIGLGSAMPHQVLATSLT